MGGEGVMARFQDKKIKNSKKRYFFQFLAVFGAQRGRFGVKYSKTYFFVIAEYRLKVQAEKIMHFQNFFQKSLNNENFHS